MNKIINYEKKYTIAHMLIMLVITMFYSFVFYDEYSYDTLFYKAILFNWLILAFKTIIINKDKIFKIFLKHNLYNFVKLIELFGVSFLIISSRILDSGFDITLLYVMFLIEAYLANTKLDEYFYKIFYILPFLILNIAFLGSSSIEKTNIIYLVTNIVLFIVVQNILGYNIKDLKSLYKESEHKNVKLKDSKNKLTVTNNKLQIEKEHLAKLESKFRKKAGELYILKETCNFINTQLETEKLLVRVLDVIRGIIATDVIAILLIDKDSKDISIRTMYDEKEEVKIKQNILDNSDVFMGYKYPYYSNKVDKSSKTFIASDKTNSFAIIPLISKEKHHGAIILEKEYRNYFDESTMEFLKYLSTEILLAIENAQLYESVEELAIKDGLTKVYNRTYMKQRMEEVLNQIEEEKQNVCISMFDIDGFKGFNDTYGHLFGDKVLKELARFVQKQVISYDGEIFRYGGDEFVIILPNMKIDKGEKVLNKIREKISKLEIKEGVIKTSLTVSFGVISYPELVGDRDDIFKLMDKAIYESKNKGKNNVTICKY